MLVKVSQVLEVVTCHRGSGRLQGGCAILGGRTNALTHPSSKLFIGKYNYITI